ncbi:hypothetical protein [Stenotrophomonas lactitubi]|uniref:hypothetical protein n=1 Tax=Stenotrophomonas lactitubi TaxID=2045214 RepID=UPI003209C06C
MNIRLSIVEDALNKYFESGDFNGLPVRAIARKHGISAGELDPDLRALVQDEKIEIWFGNIHPNPHIKAFSWVTKEQQIEFLDSIGLSDDCCVYPSKKTLEKEPRVAGYLDRPYAHEIAKGAGQLDHRTFELSVLEFYRNDPRYYYQTDDINGSICIEDAFYESEEIQERDQVLLKTFGFAYDSEFNRFAASFIRYLADLSSEHQQIWKAKEVSGKHTLHPDYYRTNIIGDWGIKVSIFEAFTEELSIINEMCKLIGRPVLFRQTFAESRPKKFGFLLRPTLSEFNAFVLLLDQMLSDNINSGFFTDIDKEQEEERPDGKIVVRQKGTIAMLEEWVNRNFRPHDPEPVEFLFKTLRRVRKLRQKPAHAINEDAFDQKYFKEQRSLVMDSYNAVRLIRLILSNHPAVRKSPPEVSEYVRDGKIWDI